MAGGFWGRLEARMELLWCLGMGWRGWWAVFGGPEVRMRVWRGCRINVGAGD